MRLAPDQGFIKVPLNKFKSNKLISINETTNNPHTATASTKSTAMTSPTKRPLKSSTHSFSVKKEAIIPSNPTTNTNGPEPPSNNNNSSTSNKTKVDDWFTKIQAHKSTRQLGCNLKSYAKILKSLGEKIATGHTSTITTTIQSNIFTTSHHNHNLAGAKVSDQPDVKTSPPTQVKPQTFSSTIVPTISSINLDRTLFEELRISKHLESQPMAGVIQPMPSLTTSSHTSSLSNLLNQPINQTDIINLGQTDFNLNHSHSNSSNGNGANSTVSSNQQAQILTNFSSSNNLSATNPLGADQNTSHHSGPSNSAMSSNSILLQQQQQTLNNLASGSNLTQVAQLTANLAQPPCLVVYIIDPFDFYLYNRVRLNKSKSSGNGNYSSAHGTKSPTKNSAASTLASNKNSSGKTNLKKTVSFC